MRVASHIVTLTRQTATMATPPGLECFGSVQVSTSGGSGKWFDLPPVKLYTLSLIIKSGKVTYADFCPTARSLTWSPNKILLGYKKRGFGKDM